LFQEILENYDQKSKYSIQEDLIQMEDMITELLESARLNNPNSSLNKEKIDLNKFIVAVVKTYDGSKPPVEFIPTETDKILFADRNRLLICMSNIINNALKYSYKQSKSVAVEIKETSNKIFITISDFGIGIPVADQKHIFEPFYRVDKSRNSKTGGYGLGLNLCKTIMNAHGGEITIESTEKEKTIFTLEFPIIL